MVLALKYPVVAGFPVWSMVLCQAMLLAVKGHPLLLLVHCTSKHYHTPENEKVLGRRLER